MHVEFSALITAGIVAAAVAAAGAMAWQFLTPKPRTLPLAERKQKLAHVEQVFQRQFPKVSQQLAAQLQWFQRAVAILLLQNSSALRIDVGSMHNAASSALLDTARSTHAQLESWHLG